MELLTAAIEPWTERRRRAAELAEVHPHAAEMLGLYLALADAWADAADEARAECPDAVGLAAYAAARVMPGVLAATLAAAPERLRRAVVDRCHQADLEVLVNRWLIGGELAATDRYLARASAAPLLETLPGVARATGAVAPDARHCPVCAGLPQLAYHAISGEALVTAPRYLLCSRCAHSWAFPRMVCPGCGCQDTARLQIYADTERFPSLRIDTCDACSGYLVTVDLAKDPAAVPVVDEIAALPLDLYAQERGFHKITANLMGI